MKNFWGIWNIIFVMLLVPGLGLIIMAPFLPSLGQGDIMEVFFVSGSIMVGAAAGWVGLFFLWKKLSQ